MFKNILQAAFTLFKVGLIISFILGFILNVYLYIQYITVTQYYTSNIELGSCIDYFFCDPLYFTIWSNVAYTILLSFFAVLNQLWRKNGKTVIIFSLVFIFLLGFYYIINNSAYVSITSFNRNSFIFGYTIKLSLLQVYFYVFIIFLPSFIISIWIILDWLYFHLWKKKK
jgi:hypothetical protein